MQSRRLVTNAQLANADERGSLDFVAPPNPELLDAIMGTLLHRSQDFFSLLVTARLFCFFSSPTTPVSSNNHMLFTLFIVACARPIHSTSDCTPSSTGEIALSQTPRSPLVYYYYYYYRYYYYYHSHYDRIYRKNSPSCVVITLITTSATTGPRNTTRDLYHSGRFFFTLDRFA